MKHSGSCHCGNVKYEVEGEIDKAIACNCSMCQRKGSLLWFVPIDQFTLLSDPGASRTYQFNKHRIDHTFCTTCGIHPYAVGTDRHGTRMAAINVRCIEGIELDQVPVAHFDGRAL